MSRMTSVSKTLLFVIIVSIFSISSAQADPELDALKKMVQQQNDVIKQLQSTVQKLVADQIKLKDVANKTQASSTSKSAVASTVAAGQPADAQTYVTMDSVNKAIADYDRNVGSKFMLSGYGAAGYFDSQHAPGSFQGDFNPLLIFKLNDSIQMVSEIEVQLRDDTADFDLEQAAIDYFIHDNITLTGGKFLVPFNAFSEKVHPAWINKLPSFAPIYNDENTGGHPGVVSLMSDVGLKASGGVPIGDESKLNYSLYVVNGPRMVAAAGKSLVRDAPTDVAPVELEWGHNLTDENSNKVFGGRIAASPIMQAEVGLSGMTGKYDVSNQGFSMWGADAAAHERGLELRGEYLRLSTDVADAATQHRDGFYVQTSYRPGRSSLTSSLPNFVKKLEPVVRYGRADTIDGTARQWAVGIDYWVEETVPLKFAYEFNSGPNELSYDRFLAQLAYGF
jgi:hypothetical protein